MMELEQFEEGKEIPQQTISREKHEDNKPDLAELTLKVVSIFESIQGEGIYIGEPTVFLRTAGCNLHCGWCDTKSANTEIEKYQDIPLLKVLRTLLNFKAKNICITGGEPLIHKPQIDLLCQYLYAHHKVTIETNGTIVPPYYDFVDLLSVSPKLKSSVPIGEELETIHEEQRKKPLVLKYMFQHPYNIQLKFVIGGQEDADEVMAILDKLDRDGCIWNNNIHYLVFQPADIINYSEVYEHRVFKSFGVIWNNFFKKGGIYTARVRDYNPRILPQLHKMIGVE